MGRPDRSGRRRNARRAAGRAGRGVARRDPPPGPRRAGSGLAAARRRAARAGGRRGGRARLRPPRPAARAAGRAGRRPGDARTSASSSTTSPSRRSASGDLEPWASLLASVRRARRTSGASCPGSSPRPTGRPGGRRPRAVRRDRARDVRARRGCSSGPTGRSACSPASYARGRRRRAEPHWREPVDAPSARRSSAGAAEAAD